VLGWCLSTDTDPWQALAHRWPVAVVATLAATVASPALRRGTVAPPPQAVWLRGLIPTVAAAGITLVLPGLTAWDAATSAGATDDPAGKVATAVVAATAAVVVSVAFWWGARAAVTGAVLIGAGVAAALALLSGSVLAAALPVALLLPRTNTSRSGYRLGSDATRAELPPSNWRTSIRSHPASIGTQRTPGDGCRPTPTRSCRAACWSGRARPG
jgi:hypothetical protein